MTLVKQPITINFSKGLDTKTDPYQIPVGNFSKLSNSVFTRGGRLTKRNGFDALAALPSSASYATTFRGELTAIGSTFQVLSQSLDSWVSKGSLQPMTLGVLPIVRNNLNQSQADSSVAANGLVCTAYTEVNAAGTNTFKYVVADSSTGQNIIAPTALSADATYGAPRVFLLGSYFVIVYTRQITAAYHLQFVAVSTADPTTVKGPTDITTSYTPATTVAWDGVVLNNQLFLAWNGVTSSGITMASVSSSLSVSSTSVKDGSHTATVVGACADPQNNVVWVLYYTTSGTVGYVLALDTTLTVLPNFPAQIISSGTIKNLTGSAYSGSLTAFYETSATNNGNPANFITSKIVTQSSGAVGSAVTVAKGVGLASKAFRISSTIYVLAAYSSSYQPTYFLVNGSSSTSAAPIVVAELAYQNGGGYLATGLPGVTVSGSTAQTTYLFKDLIQAVNKNTNVPTGSQTAGIYSQTGVNIASFTVGTSDLASVEIGNNLNVTGGITWAYDGFQPVEQNFLVYPEALVSTANASTGGHLAAQVYFYAGTYEWTDQQGNAFRSAPSIPIKVDLTGAGTSTSTVTIVFPCLRLTYKTTNPVKLVLYRWSTAQQSYYQVTSIAAPTMNDTTADAVTYVDTLADATILGNNLLYTTGGVLENIGPPSFRSVFAFDDRMWGIPSEDPNNLWFSKQVLEATPVEMSDLLTKFVAPGLGAQGPTGELNCGAPMDDKAILFKSHALYYINGTGPDATGANDQYSEPIFITSTVGCSNQNSIIFVPQGLMFEFSSESGNQIWLLGRDLSTKYIGAEVEALTQNAAVTSAVNIPGTNQVRFTLSSGVSVVYDYYYEQWDTFASGPSAVSSTLYRGAHAYIDSFGRAYRQSSNSYLDGTSPVLLSLATGWINIAGVRGYQRAYALYLLGTYYSPFRLVCSIAYDYNEDPIHFAIVNPTNFAPAYGSPQPDGTATAYGADSPYGGPGNVLNWRIFFKKQRCSSFKVYIQEIYDPAYGVQAGQGLSLSGMTALVAIKSGYKTISARHTVGAK